MTLPGTLLHYKRWQLPGCEVECCADNAGLLSRYVDQGGGKRKGAFAIYLEPWHADIFNWLELRKNHGKEEVWLASHQGILQVS